MKREKGEFGKGTVRTSVSLPREHYELLASLAEENRVSVAWMVRDAVARYVEVRWPLLRGS
ncbi:MAG: ribbon-helix-helix domain-containing protein [Gammaproteobacteria bacterium]|nr:ribbon-helix-helix domain-containing protein [Gammaproteobacteria bacterium]